MKSAMKLNLWKIGIVGFAFGILSVFGNSAQASDKEIVWKCQVMWTSASPSYGGSAQPVVTEINEKCKGKFKIELYPAGSLIPTKEIFNAVKRGMVQIGAASPGYWRNKVPLANVGQLPFNFKTVWECLYYYRILGYEKMMREALSEHGMYYCTDRINPTELALKVPVTKFEDFKGLKLRSYGILQKYLTSIGAACSYVPGSEIYSALASGVFEGATWGAVQGANNSKFYEVCKYHLTTSLNITGADAWLINKKALAKLPADVRATVLNVLNSHFWKRTTEYQYGEKTTLVKVEKDYGVKPVALPEKEYIKMQVAAHKLWDEVADMNSDCAKAVKMLKDFNKSLGR